MVRPNVTQPLIITLSNGKVVTSDDVLRDFGESAFDYQTGRWKIPIPQLKHHFEEKSRREQQNAGHQKTANSISQQRQAQHPLQQARPRHLLSAFSRRPASRPAQPNQHPLLKHFKASQQGAKVPAHSPQHPLVAKFGQAQQASKPRGLLSKLAGLFKKKQ